MIRGVRMLDGLLSVCCMFSIILSRYTLVSTINMSIHIYEYPFETRTIAKNMIEPRKHKKHTSKQHTKTTTHKKRHTQTRHKQQKTKQQHEGTTTTGPYLFVYYEYSQWSQDVGCVA